MELSFIDLKTQYKLIEKNLLPRLKKIMSEARFILGEEVQQLEKTLASFCERKYALGCASGTDALLLALLAINLKPGDLVITTPFTFFATAEAIALLGGVPVFVDIDPKTYNLDPEKLEETLNNLKKQGKRAKALIAVDLFGLCADYEKINKICAKEDIALIEDAAQSFGASYKQKPACSFGLISCTSFFPAKPLGCFGDGGMCFTDSKEIYELLVSLRVHGQGKDKYENLRLGLNARLDTLQAAVLLEKIKIFPQEVEKRQQVAAFYNQLLEDTPLTIPYIPKEHSSVYAQYSLLANSFEQREKILAQLKEAKIPYAIYYPIPLHLQAAFSYLGYKQGDFKVSEDIAKRIFSLPMHPYLKKEEQEFIVNQIKKALKRSS